MTLGEFMLCITTDLLRRMVGDAMAVAVCCRGADEIDVYELAGVYCVDGVCAGVENTIGAARRALTGDRRPDPLDEGCDAGGDDCGGVPRLPIDSWDSKYELRSCDVVGEYRRSTTSSRTNFGT